MNKQADKLKVYFACSIRGGRDEAGSYEELIEYISDHAVVLSEIFADQKLTSDGMNKPSPDIWKTDMAWVDEADVLIAEVSQPSLGVGYEIAKAESMNKPVLCLYRKQQSKKLSAMIEGSPHVTVVEYETVEDTKHAIKLFLSELV